MKKLLSVIFLGLAVITASASDIEKRRAEETSKKYKEYTTFAGRVYQDVTITAINDAGISITHADGSARLRFEQLSPDQRTEFGITKEGAAVVYAEETKAQVAYEAKLEEQQKTRRELLAKQTAAQAEAERLAALEPRQNRTTVIQSTVEIPTFPVIRGSENAVLYQTQRHSPNRSTYYYGGRYYAYPAQYGYHPGHHHHVYPSGNGCAPTPRSSIFHFTIK